LLSESAPRKDDMIEYQFIKGEGGGSRNYCILLPILLPINFVKAGLLFFRLIRSHDLR
jgi:hypothetical protein